MVWRGCIGRSSSTTPSLTTRLSSHASPSASAAGRLSRSGSWRTLASRTWPLTSSSRCRPLQTRSSWLRRRSGSLALLSVVPTADVRRGRPVLCSGARCEFFVWLGTDGGKRPIVRRVIAHAFLASLLAMQRVVDAVRSLSVLDLEREERAISSAGLDDYEARRQSARNRRRSAAWGRAKARVYLRAVLDPDGHPFGDDEQAAEALFRHRAPIFEGSDCNHEAQQRLLAHELHWEGALRASLLDEDRLLGMVGRTGNRAPGPDGVPYAAWRRVPLRVRRLLIDAYRAMLSGATPPMQFGVSTLCFIPKASGPVPLSAGAVTASPGNLRPLTLPNTDNKIVAMFANGTLRIIAGQCCMDKELGFVEGRQLGNAVLLLEAAAMNGMRHRREGGLIFLDFKAAFPSIRYSWVFAVLRQMGVPESLCVCLAALYATTVAPIGFGTACPCVVRVTAGIRQGCPASGMVFALAIDPALRMLSTCSPSHRDALVAFADDIAMLLMLFLAGLRWLIEVMALVLAASGLKVSLDKTAVIPI